jgi:hypothetical protein
MLHKTLWTIVVVILSGSTAQGSDIRRVVTGLDANNKAVVQFDERMTLTPGPYGSAGLNLWLTDSYPPDFSFKDDPAKKPIGISPPDNGTKVRVVEFGPIDAATEAKIEPDFVMKLVGARVPTRGLPVKHPLMHRTRTLDYAVILSGEIDMMLDDTAVHLSQGDVVVQQATNHAWVNRGTQPCRILFVLMDSKQP